MGNHVTSDWLYSLSSQGTYEVTINMAGRVTATISVTSKRLVPCKLSQARGLAYRSLLHPGGSVYGVATLARSDV